MSEQSPKDSVVFRPSLDVEGYADDEVLIQLDGYFIHVERMATESIWIGISKDGAKYPLHLDFVIDTDRKVKNEEGKKVHPLKLFVRLDGEWLSKYVDR